MADVRPFRGVRYNLEKIGDASKLIAPPYDIITPQTQSKLHERDPHNVVRLILPDAAKARANAKDAYDSAALYLKDWLADGSLIRDEEESYYLVSQEFQYRGTWTRWGILTATTLEEFDRKIVLPHEHTLDGPKKEQYKLMEACDANLSPVFSCYFDEGSGIMKALKEAANAVKPVLEGTEDDGVKVKMWKISDPKTVKYVKDAFADKKLYIADGHHRYETALAYKRNMLKSHPNDATSGWNRTLMYLCEFDDPALAIRPYHRAIKHLKGMSVESFLIALGEHFNIQKLDLNPWKGGEETRDKAADILVETAKKSAAFLLIFNNDPHVYLTTPKTEALQLIKDMDWPLRRLDIIVLHKLAFEEVLEINDADLREGKIIVYDTDYREIWRAIRKNGWAAAFFLGSIKPDQVKEVAEANLIMPQKSTYFYPKITSGLVFHRFF